MRFFPSPFTAKTALRSALFTSASCAIALAAQAQTASDGTDSPDADDTVTVYATTNPIPVFDYPGQVTVITREDVETFAPSSISDMLRDVPGVDFAGGPRRTGEAPSIRGLSGENVLILLDGARQSFISAHDGRFFLDPDLVATAEAVRGPASALYGSGAVGGVLAFETVDAADLLRPGETFGARFRAGYQSVNEETLATATAFGASGGFDGLASIGLRQSGDISLADGTDLRSDDDIQSLLLKGGYQFTEAFSADASWQRFQNTAIEPNNGQGVGTTGDPLLDRDVEKDIETDSYRVGLKFDPMSNLINTSFTAYSSTTGVDEFDESTSRSALREIKTSGASIRNASRFDTENSTTIFTIGADYYEDEQTGHDTDTANGTRGGVPNANTQFTGIFAQLETEFDTAIGQFILIPGVRYDEFESSSESAPAGSSDDSVSPRFAASYGPNDWFRVFGSYSEGFRAPSVNELYLDGIHFSVPHPILFNPAMGQFVFVNNEFVPNPNLMPEKSETIEFGVGFNFEDLATPGDRLQAKVSAYNNKVDDLVNLAVNFNYDPTCFAAPAFFPCTAGTTNSANVDAAEFDGVEAELVYDSDSIYTRASYASIDGKIVGTGADPFSTTPDRLAVDFGVKLPAYRARIGSRVQVADEFDRYVSDGAGGLTLSERRPGYVALDLYASWRPAFNASLRIDVGVDNILDHRYDRVFEGVTEPGRNFKIAASWQIGG